MTRINLSGLLQSCDGMKYVYPEVYQECVTSTPDEQLMCYLGDECKCAAKVAATWKEIKFSHPIYSRRQRINVWCDYLIESGKATFEDIHGLMTKDHAKKYRDDL